MKILLTNNYHNRRGGADVVYFNTAELLRKHGHQVVDFALRVDKNEESEYSHYFPESTDYRTGSLFKKMLSIKSFIYNRKASRNLSALIKDEKPDIAHIHLFLGGLTTSIISTLKKCNVPTVHTVHDYRLICPAYTFLDRKNNVCELCKDGLYLRCAFHRCSLEGRFSHSMMLTLDAYYRKYCKNPSKLIDQLIFVSNFSRNKHAEFNSNYALNANVLYNFKPGVFSMSVVKGNYLFFYGRLSREKGIELLIKCSKRLKCKLIIAGTGPLMDDLINQSDEYLEIIGYKRGEELWNLIRNSSFVIVPSEWYENNPLTVVESFSFGKPVIGSNIGGIPELLEHGRGILFEPKNESSMMTAIDKAMKMSNVEYNQISKTVFDFATENFSEDAHYKALMNIYKSALHD
ncbi:MAG: hypothetical protein A2W93_04715 [Bacteroidetes bacterium GWF2_43_63]|nr:MAG: hypothetical protein A2W94_12705 [Bacteroidetes bacterium GWE2_42_42]OFY56102.1 MAG: hypothetical protein A2W93_04715 [Bacteroidetes bacterium GWF2_43_63]